VTRLQRIDLEDFTGGLNLHDGQLQLGNAESPSMQNMQVDPRSGFFTRPGWTRWNTADIVTGAWNPRSAEAHPLSDGSQQVYVTNEADIYAAGVDGNFGTDAPLGIPCNAVPHLADIGLWGDTAYFATGRNAATIGGAPTKRVGTGAPVPLADASLNFNDDYTIPTAKPPAMPFADLCEPHAGYLFVGSTNESVVGEKLNRIRWSHPNQPEAWATDDYLDIEIGGGRITALRSFRDHLLIFKTDSVWALYGYDLESWQLIKLSRSVGTPSPAAVGRNESAIFFFSDTGRNGIYAYTGDNIEDIALALQSSLEVLTQVNDVWVGWVNSKLWCSVPWDFDDGPAGSGVFVMHPDVNGAWTFHKPALGALRAVVESSDFGTNPPLAVHSGGGTSVVLKLDFDESVAADVIADNVTATPFATWYRTAWQNAGWPELRKSFLRTRWIARRVNQAVEIRLDVFKDYEEASAVRSISGVINVDAPIFWRELGFDDPAGKGFDFKELGAADPSGRGADFAGGPEGSQIGRTRSGFGPARAIQLEISGADSTLGLPWAIDAIFMKVVFRRFTT
jgi:hypothetical protein